MTSVVNCPVLKVPEIVLCLADMHVVMTADDIKHPTAGSVRLVLELFVEKLMGVRREELHQPQFHALHLLHFPELHEDSVAEMTTIKSILRLLRSAGVSDASVLDVVEPSYLRLKLILSCLINLIKHREDVLEHYTHYSHQWETLLLNRQLVEDEVQRLEDEREAGRQRHEDETRTVEALTADIAQLTESITAFNKQHLALRDSIHGSKAEVKQLHGRIAAHTAGIAALTRDNAASRLHIVRSPERLKRSLADLSNTVAQSKAELADSTAACRDMAQRAMLLSKTEARLKQRLAALREVEALQQRTRLLVSQQREYERNIAHLRQVSTGMREEEAEAERRSAAVGERLTALKRNFERRKMEAKLALEEVEDELAAALAEARDEAGRKEEAERAVERIRREVAEEKAGHEAAMRLMKGKEREMEAAVRGWHSKLLQGMASVDQPHAPMTPKASTAPAEQQQQ